MHKWGFLFLSNSSQNRRETSFYKDNPAGIFVTRKVGRKVHDYINTVTGAII